MNAFRPPAMKTMALGNQRRFWTNANPQPMSFRKQQLESVIKREVSTILATQLSDPRVEGLVSVTRVEVTVDFAEAFIYVSVMPERFEKKTLYGLTHAAGYIHSLAFRALGLKAVPQFSFRLDSAIKKEASVLAAINRAKQRSPKDAADSAEAGTDESAGPGAGPAATPPAADSITDSSSDASASQEDPKI